jgi:Bacterial PH domain
MPALSAAVGSAVSGRRVFRPRRARVIVYVLAVAMLVTLVWIAFALPSGGEHRWGNESRASLVLLAVLFCVPLHRLAAVRVVTDDTGVTVVNVVRRHRLAWAQIVGVRLSQDDPWLVLDLDDGEAMQAMGVARSEGAAAKRAARDFARLVNEHSHVPGHD